MYSPQSLRPTLSMATSPKHVPTAEASAIYQALGCKRHSAKIVAFLLANLAFRAGDAESALICASEGLAAFRSLGYTQQSSFTPLQYVNVSHLVRSVR